MTRLRRPLPLLLLAAALAMPLLAGCQAGVMIGRVLFGDPLITPALTQVTRIKLEDQTHKVHLACVAPASVLSRYDALQMDLVEQVSRQLRKRDIPVTPPDDVSMIVDDLGGRIDPRELAAQFDDGLLVFINIEQFSLADPGDGNLHRGRMVGEVIAYEIRPTDADGEAAEDAFSEPIEVFRQEARVVYPETHPIPLDQMTASMFKRKFLARLSDEIGRKLYPFRITDTI